jgi:hypothetical protein
MDHLTYAARIVGPITFTDAFGAQASVPAGPCLIEHMNGKLFDVVWGRSGQKSARLTIDELETAVASGDVVLVD